MNNILELSRELVDREAFGRPEKMVFILCDGMGIELLNRHARMGRILSNRQTISTLFPPTTVAMTTSLNTGLSVGQHGRLAWSGRFGDRVVEFFTKKDFYDGTPVSIEFPQFETTWKKIKKTGVNVLTLEKYRLPEKSLLDMLEIAISFIKEPGKRFVFLYWNEPDHTMHKFGIGSAEVNAKIHEIEDATEYMHKSIPNATIVITADHGGIDIERVYAEDISGLSECWSMPPSMEVRVVSMNVHSDKFDQLQNIFSDKLKDFKLFTHEEYINSGLLGEGPYHEITNKQIGDFVAVSTSHRGLFNKYLPPKEIIADHSGMTPQEMEIPLIVI